MLPGNLITLDTSLRPVYCDAWDSAFIQQAEIAVSNASQAPLMSFTLNLQVTNLREVPISFPRCERGRAGQLWPFQGNRN